MNDFLKKMFISMLPKGFLWRIKQGGDLDKLFDAFGLIWEFQRSFLAQLAFISSPSKTPYLDDLEADYGIVKNDDLTEEQRRVRLDVAKNKNISDGSDDGLQQRLRDAGFDDIFVHKNNPPVDPDLFIFESFFAVCGKSDSVCGNENAVCGGSFGELLVNAEYFNFTTTYLAVCGGETIVCGNENAVTGTSFFEKEITELYEVPTEAGYWGLFFFVGGPAIRNGVTDELEEIALYEVPIESVDELKNTILKYKGSHTWGGLRLSQI